jgi:glycosyltransferase involved in cell wall biosynthesis
LSLRVLFAAPHPRDVTLGSPKLLLRIGEGLQARGHEVQYLFVSDLPARLRVRRLLYLTFPLAVAYKALQGKYDVIHVASGDAVPATAIRRLQRTQRPIVVNHVLGMEHIAWEEARRAWGSETPRPGLPHRLWTGKVRLAQVEASVRLSDRVCCSCMEDKGYMVGSGWRRANDIAIVPPGIDPEYLNTDPSDLARPTIFFLGSWTARKGIRELVAAFPKVLAAVPQARLLVAGAHVPPEMVLQAFPVHARAAVDVAAPTTEAGLVALMQQSSVSVLPSYYEGFGMAFAESMAIGLPVIATPTGGMADWIESEVNGILVPKRAPAALADALTRLLTDQGYRIRLGQAAREAVQALTWERAARDTEALYMQCFAPLPAWQSSSVERQLAVAPGPARPPAARVF